MHRRIQDYLSSTLEIKYFDDITNLTVSKKIWQAYDRIDGWKLTAYRISVCLCAVFPLIVLFELIVGNIVRFFLGNVVIYIHNRSTDRAIRNLYRKFWNQLSSAEYRKKVIIGASTTMGLITALAATIFYAVFSRREAFPEIQQRQGSFSSSVAGTVQMVFSALMMRMGDSSIQRDRRDRLASASNRQILERQ